jgi:hypothetical protein
MKATKDNKRLIGSILAATLLAGGLLLGLQASRPTPVYAHEVPSPCDFTTGGGFILIAPGEVTNQDGLPETGQKANFGLVGGCKNGGFFGHVNYVDHNNGLHVSSDTITAYVNPCPGCAPPAANNARDICGTADVSIQGSSVGTFGFRVRTIDAEQQSSPPPKDKFGIHIHQLDPSGNATNTVYLVQTRCLASDSPTGNVMTCSTVNPGGGDIELHKPNPSTTGPFVSEDQIAAACGAEDLGY